MAIFVTFFNKCKRIVPDFKLFIFKLRKIEKEKYRKQSNFSFENSRLKIGWSNLLESENKVHSPSAKIMSHKFVFMFLIKSNNRADSI